MEQIVEWAYRLLVLLGLGGGLYLLKALKGTVDAQRETIDAQAKKIEAIEGLQRTMETVLKSTDEKNMLARLQAHKEFVEHEKAADAKRLTDRFEEEKQKMFRAAETGTRVAVQKYAVPLIDSLISLARNALPYVPKSRRPEFIDALNLEEEPLRAVRTMLNDIASAAPDLSAGTTLSTVGLGSRLTLAEGAAITLAALRPPGTTREWPPPPGKE